jgi:PadR family transcriptional regulator PadR
MMTVLKDLAQRELVKRYVGKNSPRDRWELTSKGEFFLNQDLTYKTVES